MFDTESKVDRYLLGFVAAAATTLMHSGAEFQVDKLLGFVAFSKMRIIELEGTSAAGFSETNINIRLLKGKQGVTYFTPGKNNILRKSNARDNELCHEDGCVKSSSQLRGDHCKCLSNFFPS